jgi:fructose-1,6-bisphosphatase II
MPEAPDRNYALEMVRATEAAALAAARWMGRGDKNAVDQAAVNAMRLLLNTVEMDGVIVVGEGEKDAAPMLFNGERLGTGRPPEVDIAVDPIDGTRLTAEGGPGALAVVAIAERGTMYSPGSVVYMDKIAVGPLSRGAIDINRPVGDNLKAVAQARAKDVDDLTVMILDRPRHSQLIQEVREAGARIRLIRDGDVAGSIAAAQPGTGIDILMGIGGSPEAVLSACALKCMGGELQCKLWPRDESERQFALEQGLDLDRVLTIEDLVSGENVFFAATGVTDGEFLKGIHFYGTGAHTTSVVMRSRTGTIRYIEAEHRWEKLMRFSLIEFDR